MVLEFFNDGSILISDIKSNQQFNINNHRLKPYLTSEPPAPADKVDMHLPEYARTWRRYHPRPISSCRFLLGFIRLKMLNLALLGGTPRLSYFLVFFLYFVFSFYRCRRKTTLGKGAHARNPLNEHQRINEFF